MRLFIISILPLFLFVCIGQNANVQGNEMNDCLNYVDQFDSSISKDSTPLKKFREEISDTEPEFPNAIYAKFDIRDTTRYLKVVVNNNKLVKAWMVFHDAETQKWHTLTWEGKGNENSLLIDTVFNQKVGVNRSQKEFPSFYMAESPDDGETWKPLNLDFAPLTCMNTKVKRKATYAQLIVSTDYMTFKKPSVAFIWQWSYIPAERKGSNGAATFDFSNLCDKVFDVSSREIR